ncbi:3-mercaptopyruvate sulfurtransferase [Aurantimonas sp. A2-1-M11]|uniref:3-mercaptopyruvate sulfurtransferase n=1 Tax=Aurantimonas sp. A2-1-M11 TaxID=3113712 RepID=UPI002F958FC4
MSHNPFLITPDELAERLGRPGLSVVDASWYLPAQKRMAEPEFEIAHIPGAVFFDQDAIVDPVSPLPHTLPSAEIFADAVGRLGIAETDTIVVYDGLGLFSAPRVWWMFRAFGARDVRLLDGGFPAWRNGDHPVESGKAAPEPATFQARFDTDAVVTLAQMRRAVDDPALQVVDARPADRFAGEAAEPREGVRSGHMPGAFNLPFLQLAEDGRLKSPDELRAAFAAAGVDPTGPVVTSCGSGVTAAVLNLALETLGNRQARLYDGSWTEWGGATDTPVVTGH